MHTCLEMTSAARPRSVANLIIAELGAQIVKTYYCPEDSESVTAACPVPIIMARGQKLSSFDALTMDSRAMLAGAFGAGMERNIFQRSAPVAMLSAVRAIAHEDLPPSPHTKFTRTLVAAQSTSR